LTAEFKHKLNQANETISDLEASRALANEGAAKLVQNRDEWRKCAEGLASVARPDYVNEQDFDPEVAYDDVRKALADFERLKGQP
jgi:uncharacterized protein YjbK